MALTSDSALVGSPYDDGSGSLEDGSAYLFDTCTLHPTVSATYTCSPTSGTVPFATTMGLEMANKYTLFGRRIDGRINVSLANGNFYGNWRGGHTPVPPRGQFRTGWLQRIPALGALIGDNVFTLVVEDVTWAPYNQPPYPPAGDTATASCTVPGIAP